MREWDARSTPMPKPRIWFDSLYGANLFTGNMTAMRPRANWSDRWNVRKKLTNGTESALESDS